MLNRENSPIDNDANRIFFLTVVFFPLFMGSGIVAPSGMAAIHLLAILLNFE